MDVHRRILSIFRGNIALAVIVKEALPSETVLDNVSGVKMIRSFQ